MKTPISSSFRALMQGTLLAKVILFLNRVRLLFLNHRVLPLLSSFAGWHANKGSLIEAAAH